MRPIQLLLLAFTLFALWRVLQKHRSGGLGTMQSLRWLLVWFGAILVASFPATTNFLADALGIWRGADLVFYTSLSVIFYLIFRIHLALDRVQQEITEIVRSLALDRVKTEGSAVAEARGGKES